MRTALALFLMACSFPAVASGILDHGEQTNGNVEVRIDAAGRLVVLIDGYFPDTDEEIDGEPTLAGLFEPASPIGGRSDFPIRMENAIVSMAGSSRAGGVEWKRLRVTGHATTADGTELDSLTVAIDQTDRHGRESLDLDPYGDGLIAAASGVAFHTRRFGLPRKDRTTVEVQPLPFARFGEVETGDWKIVFMEAEPAETARACESGGEGAAGCSQGCRSQIGATFSIGGVGVGSESSRDKSCSTSCREGYYACCYCENKAIIGTDYRAKCQCVKDKSDPDEPKADPVR